MADQETSPGDRTALVQRLRRMGEGLRGGYDEDSEAARRAADLLASPGEIGTVEYAPFRWCLTHGKFATALSGGTCCTFAQCGCRPGCDVRRLIIEGQDGGGAQ